MDFDFSPEADEAAELAARILADHTTPELLADVDRAPERFRPGLLDALAGAGLAGLHLPEEYGGAGLTPPDGMTAAARVLIECGRRVAPVPLTTHVAATAWLARHAESPADTLAGAADGSRWWGVALAEPHDHLPAAPSVRAEREGAGWVLSGTKTLVRAPYRLDGVLVTAGTPDGPAVFSVDLGSGPRIELQHTSDGDVTGLLTFAGTPAQLLGDAATELADLHTACAAAEQVGILHGALDLTASYARIREQFGRPIGTFQAVGQRLADGYIDVEMAELTMWQAVWRLAEGLPAGLEVATAAFWAADAGHRVAHTTVHVHGGVGIDLDGEAHRYFTAAKRWELVAGGATRQSLVVGRSLAETPATQPAGGAS